MRKYSLLLWLLFCLASAWAQPMDGQVRFVSSDSALTAGFAWARAEALSKVRRNGDPVGDWYEAALPARDAFCMRDVSHQLSGANLLGLADINRNLLLHFAASVSASRDWCGYWEIDKLNRPAPVDYKTDADFWFNLPGNFDVLNACLRQYQWTGDSVYISNPVFREFYQRTTNDFVRRWDHDGDTLMEGTSSAAVPYRGIGSYEESKAGMTGNDLIAAEALAMSSYAALLVPMGRRTEGRPYTDISNRLFHRFQNQWWDEEKKVYRQFRQRDGSWLLNDPMQLYLLRWNFIASNRIKPVIESLLLSEGGMNVEMLSYFSREMFRYGETGHGIRLLRKMTARELPRREYPEVSFAALEAYSEGLMGLGVSASDFTVSTLPRLADNSMTATLAQVPLLGGTIDVAHVGRSKTTFTNRTPHALFWFACFNSESGRIVVDGQIQQGTAFLDLRGRKIISTRVRVPAGATATVSLPGM